MKLGTTDIALRRSRQAKRLGLTVYPDSRVVVTVPLGFGRTAVLKFVSQNSGWIKRQLTEMAKYGDCTFMPGGRNDYLRHKERARSLVHETLRLQNVHYGFAWNRVSIKNLRRNWGSCSVRQNLNFNYKLVHLPYRLAEYVIVHELCHLGEMNHSKRFWELVARTVPDHKERRKELRKYMM